MQVVFFWRLGVTHLPIRKAQSFLHFKPLGQMLYPGQPFTAQAISFFESLRYSFPLFHSRKGIGSAGTPSKPPMFFCIQITPSHWPFL